MKQKNACKRLISAVLCFVMVLSLWAPVAYAKVGDPWQGTANGQVLIKSTTTKLADNVYEHEVITNNESGGNQKIDYLCEVGKSDSIKIVAGYGKDDASKWSLTPTTVQAKAYEQNHKGHTVVAAINADFFNMANGQPLGALVMEGVEYSAANGRPFFGITKDGQPVIRQDNNLSDLETAVGGDVILIADGQPITENTEYGALAYSRTAIGIKADGTVVTFVTRGLQAPISGGRTYTEIAEMLAAEGCTWALALDGGGSATYAGRPEGTSELVVSNYPVDGAERAVSSSLLIVSTKEKTGVFDRAQLSPNNEVYTPKSEIQFEAVGVDTAGFGMNLPEGTTYALADECKDLGTIDAKTGLFKAGEKTGVVTVNMMYQEKVIGTTTVEIATPDSIYFGSEEVSLGFEDESDLGLVVRSKGRDMIYNVGDIKWEISNVVNDNKEEISAENLGKFEGNTFIAHDSVSSTGQVKAVSAYDENVFGEIKVIVGKLPTIVWDFEDKYDENGNLVTKAEDYYVNGYNNGTEDVAPLLTHSNYGRGGNESIEIVSSDDDEPVRFGNNSLKLNYDFINCGAVTEGACIGTSDSLVVPGVPTGIGAWVYAPEGVGIDWPNEDGQSGLWLRGYIRDGSGSNKQYDFTLEPKNQLVVDGKEKPGIYWEGWKYVEADITSLQAPYSIQPGMTFRLMYVAGTKMGTKSANAIYFDNLQFVYGTNVDDVDEPYVGSMQINGEELKDGMTVSSDVVTIDAILQDVQNKYTTGIDDTTVRMYIDGINVVDNPKYKDNYGYSSSDDRCQLSHLKLRNGKHSVTVKAKDGFGNEVVDTRYFTVDTTTATGDTTVIVKPATEKAIIGKTINLEILASDNTVTASTTILRLGSQFKEYDVTFSDNYEGKATYSKMEKTITVKATKKEAAVIAEGEKNVIATVSVKVPADLKATDSFTYTIKGGEFETAAGGYATYSSSELAVPIGADYDIHAEKLVVGGEPARITVTDVDGKAAVGVNLYLEDGTLIGTTDENGVYETAQFNGAEAEAKNYTIYAKDDKGNLSFNYKLSVFASKGDTEGAAYNVRFNGVEDGATEKNITWFSNTLNSGRQIIKYAVSGTENWTVVEAEKERVHFEMNGNNTVNVNSVYLKDLTPNTTYDYVVGSEGKMSEVATFKTSPANNENNKFFIIGDIQDPDKSKAQTVTEKIDAKNTAYDFGIQIGDAIDQAADFTDWSDLGEVLGAKMLGGTNMINVMGNHEYYSDPKAEIAAAIYNSDKTGEGAYYSVEYGNMYIAVINFSNTAAPIKKAAEWLEKDAAKSDATWKVLAMHQPPYYTNEGGNGPVYAAIPDAAEAAGIDVVFSGHDHSYGVTNPLKDDKIDEKNGIVYYLVGAAGSKRYGLSTQDKFDYNTIFKDGKVSADYTATYLQVTSDEDQMKVCLYDVDAGLLDETIIESECKKNGHKTGAFDPEKNELPCAVCHKLIENYTGEVFDAKENEYYLLKNKVQTEWVTVGEEIRYYGKNGIREKVTAEEIPSTCIVDGQCTYTAESGAVKVVAYKDAGGHEIKEVDGKTICEKCGWEQFDMKDCKVTLSTEVYTYNGNKRTPSTTVVDPNGNTLAKKNNSTHPDYTTAYSNNVEVGTASAKLTAAKYAVYVDMNSWRGNYRNSVTVNYEIRPDAPTNAKLTRKNNNYTLSWNRAKYENESVDSYVVYRSINDGDWKEIKTTTGTSLSVKVNKDDVYKFRIYSRKKAADGKTYESVKYASAANLHVSNLKGSTNEKGKPRLTWESIDGAQFEILRATSKNGTYKKIYTAKAMSFTNTSATSGKTYYYKVRAKYDGVTVTSAPVKVTAKLDIPNVSISNRASSGAPRLTWKKVVNADRYYVYRATSKDGEFKLAYKTTGTAYTNTSAKPTEQYYYKVQAIKDNKKAINSEFSEVKTRVCDLPQPEVKIANNAKGYPRLTWDAIEGADRYYVYRATSKNGTYKRISRTTGTALTNVSVTRGKMYYYKVKAVCDADSQANSANSAIVSRRCKLEAPDVKIKLNSAGNPRLTWDKVDNADRYYVYRATSKNGSYKRIVRTTKTSLTNSSVKNGKTYYYKVKAIYDPSSSGNSNYSEVVSIKVTK